MQSIKQVVQDKIGFLGLAQNLIVRVRGFIIYLRAFFYLTFDLAFSQCYFCGILVNDFVQFTHI